MVFYSINYTAKICIRRKSEFFLGNYIPGIDCTQGGAFHFAFCQERKEKSNSDQCVAAIMQLRINYTSIAFSSYYSISHFHFFHNIYFTYSRRKMSAAVLKCYISQCLCRRKIGNRISGSIFKYIVGYRNKRIFLSKHSSVFTYYCESVNIRVNNKS